MSKLLSGIKINGVTAIMFHWWNAIIDWFKKQDSFSLLSYSTVLISIIVLIYILVAHRKKIKAWVALLTVLIANYILITSYYDCFRSASQNPKDFWAVVSVSLLFLLVIFLKAVLCFVLYSLFLLMIQPDTLTEFVAKFFGMEIQYKRNAKVALNNMLESKKQIDFIEDINEYTLEYLSSSFEEKILLCFNRHNYQLG